MIICASSFVFIVFFVLLSESQCSQPGPAIKATKGSVWPKPQQQLNKDLFYTVDSDKFQFNVHDNTCDILKEAILRYDAILRRMRRVAVRANAALNISTPIFDEDPKYGGDLTSLIINLTEPCEKYPYINMVESYEVIVQEQSFAAYVRSQSIWGILRGLETFVQLLYFIEGSEKLAVNVTEIVDFPRFPHRGMLIDSGRHFLPVRIIYAILEGMTMNKLNVLHWHIVDDQSFPFVSTIYPELSKKGAYSPLHVYTPEDVQSVIEIARLRGIRVIPEFDTPGHTSSWGIAHPEILTECCNDNGKPDGSLGPINPVSNVSYNFVNGLLQELATVFPDKYIHLGGDEVPFDCWESNPQIKEYMNQTNATIQDLEGQYILQLVNKTKDIGLTPIVWQEVFDNGVKIPKSTVVHVWKGWTEYTDMMDNITKAGYTGILSSCWYLDHLYTGGDWERFYGCDASNYLPTEKQKSLVLGGEACMWGESVDATNIQPRIWPRASAAAEKLWSAEVSHNVTLQIRQRLEEHSCRMNWRGVPSQPPNGPGFCPYQLYN